MISKSSPESQHNLFQAHFDQLLDPKHPLVILANKIDWKRFDLALADCYSADFGRPAQSTRLMVGFLYLKYTFDVSDEDLPARWVENPYWQYFCGYSYMQHEMPLDYTTIIKWRSKVGSARLEELLKETIALALKEKQVTQKELASVNIDTTVQEKNITYPTDAKLCSRAIEKLGKAAKERSIKLRQSYGRVSKQFAIKVARYAHAKQFKRMKQAMRKLKTWLGRLLRDIGRKAEQPDEELARLLALCRRVQEQQPKDTNKLYSLHEPQVQCISKGKAHQRYEFGGKVAIASTNKSNWVLCAQALSGNPYDGHTLEPTLSAVERISGAAVAEAFVDKGYRGHGYTGAASIHISGLGKVTSLALRRRKLRRSAIEPKIGHMKSDNRMWRCFLKGELGDAINAVLSAAGSNMRKLLKYLGSFFSLLYLSRWYAGK